MSKLEQAGPLQLELPFDAGDPVRAGSPIGAAQLMVDAVFAFIDARP